MEAVTYESALDRHGIAVPDHLEAQAEVPVLSGMQTQGDVIVVPVEEAPEGEPIGRGGVQVVRGEATANTHWLDNGHPDAASCLWAPADRGGLTLGHLTVPDGQVAYLTHTDEHGSNGIAPGCYRVGRQREMADEVRRVAD